MRRTDRAQASVEVVVALPVVILLVLLIVQAGVLVTQQIELINATRAAGRAFAADPTAAAARRALGSAGLSEADLTLRGRAAPGDLVTVVVEVDAATDLPLVGPLLPDPRLQAQVVVRVE